jgi:glycosyltransferase involved in cell wall biosynthesis
MSARIAMVAFSYYLFEPRIRRESEALADAGYEIDVICVQKEGEPREEIVHNVRIYRMPLQRKRGSKLRYIWEYFYFTVSAFLKITSLYFKRKYKIICAHNMPDFLVFTGLIPRLMGAKIILDLHDPMPEVFMTKYEKDEKNFIIRTLVFLEKISVKFSEVVFTPNIAFKNLFLRSCPAEKMHVVMNSPDENIFTPKNPNNKPDPNKFTLMYHGSIVERNGLDIALYAIAKLKDKIPHLIFHVYGEGDFVPRFLELIKELQIENYVNYHGQTSLENIVTALEKVNLGIVPNKSNAFTQLNVPTRIFECLRMNKPIVAPATRGVLDYFNKSNLFLFEPGNADDLAKVILDVYENPEQRQIILEAGIKILEKHAWGNEKQLWIKIFDQLTA